MNQPNKLECYIILDWKGFPITNTPTSWSDLKATKKKFCEYHTRAGIYKTIYKLLVLYRMHQSATNLLSYHDNGKIIVKVFVGLRIDNYFQT